MSIVDQEQSIDITLVDRCVGRLGTERDQTLPLLQAVQAAYGYLPGEALQRLSELIDRPLEQLWGVATFYDQFRFDPIGQHRIRVCVGTACHVKGADLVYDAMQRHLQIEEGKDTDAQRLFTVERVACLGCCTLAPAVQIGEVTYGHVTGQSVPEVIADFLEREKSGSKAARKGIEEVVSPHGEIRIGLGSCCVARGSGKLHKAIEQVMAETSIKAAVKQVGCVGMCYQTPLLEIVLPDGQSFLYVRVEPEDAREILLKHFELSGAGKRWSNTIRGTLNRIVTDTVAESVECYPVQVREPQIADFLERQKRISTEYCGVLDPVDLEEYKNKDGFSALEKCFGDFDADQVIHEIEVSGLRGRGGAGYPTYLKWQAVHENPAETKYIVCNGDEGDPGAFMDRMLMESYPFRILEGMIIAARTVGASKGYLYIRDEYPLAVDRVQRAIEMCRENGYLGEHICGSNFSLNLAICTGAGAFVCGEETGLMASIEGRRPMPQLRPPYPSRYGLWGYPTLINNVETYSLVPWIVRNGGMALSQMGTADSKGTKVFALAGKVARGGLIEVPMGVTIRQVVEEIGGGIAGDKKLKAVQIGGPSGGCVPESLSDTPIDFKSLHDVGAIMGSGGMVVLDETDCMVDIARYFLEFTQNQSCGRCTFCRVGTRRMLEMLENLCSGKARKGDLEKLAELGRQIKQSSICGLGKTAPNPVLSTLEYFRDEYESHLEGKCPAGKCRALIQYTINDKCIGCTICAQKCPTDALEFLPYRQHEINQEKCVRCGTCKTVCPADAVDVE